MISDPFLESPTKTKRGLCAVKYCRNMKPPERRICHKCRSARKRKVDPIAYTFNAVKQNAKRRGKVFTISIDYFRELCEKSGYIEKKGRSADSMSLDRIDPRRGYEPGNIRVVSLSFNSSRPHHESDDDLPF